MTQPTGGQADVRLTGPDDVNQVSVVLQEADPAIADPDLQLARCEHHRAVPQRHHGRRGPRGPGRHPATGNDRRLVVEDAEPVTVEADGALVDGTVVAYREVIPVPAQW